ncbi:MULTISPECIES: alpha/beta fold hydrolase [Bradyrhizobium]|uniref:alpha/beta fold hydrolase n=3 Tax=Nitrobacteraceae TaxID=41294 RepID=UPI000FAB5A27|nr:alpha/beta hydrolase [Bradyrhizobium denitrificans]RTM01337.1 MAG: alpha/beta hydrolase [Bradyrhizobiaceae bacterium]
MPTPPGGLHARSRQWRQAVLRRRGGRARPRRSGDAAEADGAAAAWRPRIRPHQLQARLLRAHRHCPTRLSRPPRQRPQRGRAAGALDAPAQWGDDVKAFCDIVGIVDPIVLGVSFGGFVAMSYATRHPEHPAKLILISTEAKGQSYLEQRVALFESLGGPEVGALARRRFLETGGHKDQASVEAWQRLALPLYTRKGHDPEMMARALRRPAVLQWFTRPGGEVTSFDLVPDLHRISCPTLVMGGEDDPMTPIACQVDIAAALRPDLVRFERFADCGHGVVSDQPERAFAVIRDFILGTHG